MYFYSVKYLLKHSCLHRFNKKKTFILEIPSDFGKSYDLSKDDESEPELTPFEYHSRLYDMEGLGNLLHHLTRAPKDIYLPPNDFLFARYKQKKNKTDYLEEYIVSLPQKYIENTS